MLKDSVTILPFHITRIRDIAQKKFTNFTDRAIGQSGETIIGYFFRWNRSVQFSLLSRVMSNIRPKSKDTEHTGICHIGPIACLQSNDS